MVLQMVNVNRTIRYVDSPLNTVDPVLGGELGDIQVRTAPLWVKLEYKAEEHGIVVDRKSERDTSKTCSCCGRKRDANAAWNILSRGLKDIGVGHSESTPVETTLPVDIPVSAKLVVETGSPTLTERTASAVSE
ncbi:hypothetical protein CP556_14885 [Natrinema sp. CBA1119]|nr:hypothetical protein CP556_14885 [Natrinema sp. CBA1119]